jgi:hypothetical protein
MSFQRETLENLRRVAQRSCYQRFLPGREVCPSKVASLWRPIPRAAKGVLIAL